MVTEGGAAFPKETSEPLMSKTNLTGHGFQRPARSVGGFRSLKDLFGCSRRLLRLVSPAVRPVPSRADRPMRSQHLDRRRGKFRQASRKLHR